VRLTSAAVGASPGPQGPLPPPAPQILKRRSDFVRAAGALRQGTPGFLLQARPRSPDEGARGIRVGFTCSRKVGNAVARNRAKRRLRAIARLVLPLAGRDGWDYVLIGRPEATATHPFTALQDDLRRALARLHAAPAMTPPP
jgi:ribonuclease P protein component